MRDGGEQKKMRAISRWYKHHNNNTSAKHFTLEHAGHGDACVRRQASTASVGARVAEMSNAVSESTDGSDERCVCLAVAGLAGPRRVRLSAIFDSRPQRRERRPLVDGDMYRGSMQ